MENHSERVRERWRESGLIPMRLVPPRIAYPIAELNVFSPPHRLTVSRPGPLERPRRQLSSANVITIPGIRRAVISQRIPVIQKRPNEPPVVILQGVASRAERDRGATQPLLLRFNSDGISSISRI